MKEYVAPGSKSIVAGWVLTMNVPITTLGASAADSAVTWFTLPCDGALGLSWGPLLSRLRLPGINVGVVSLLAADLGGSGAAGDAREEERKGERGADGRARLSEEGRNGAREKLGRAAGRVEEREGGWAAGRKGGPQVDWAAG
jgi:hypothetical protein